MPSDTISCVSNRSLPGPELATPHQPAIKQKYATN